jgi:predicted small lipoprotein YifL
MPPLTPSSGRLVLVAGLVALALAACGRRGQPEPPPDPSVSAAQRQTANQSLPSAQPTQAAEGEEAETETFVPTANPTPQRRGARRGFVIPKEPFVLDPLL